MRKWVLTLVVFSVFASGSALMAEDLAVTTTVYCQDASLPQVFEACEEVQLLEHLGNRVRVYSKPKQQVMSLKPETIFVARLAASGEKLSVGENITVAASRIWNTSRPGFLGMCKIKEVLKNDQLRVECGRYRDERISKTSVYRMKPIDFVTQRSEFKLQPTAAN